MPTYEYLCQSCGARFEAWQKMSDDPIDTCPTCGNHVRRIIFPVGLVFKGSGFYINDIRSAASPGKSTGDAAPSSTAETAEAGNGKPEASPATSPADSSSSGSSAGSGGSDKPSTSTAAGASPTTSGT
jgi:putative FmdB family regulatory protein